MDISALGLQDPTQTFQKWYGVTQPLRDMRAQEKQDALDQAKLGIAQQNADLARQKAEAEAQAEAKHQADTDAAMAAYQKDPSGDNLFNLINTYDPKKAEQAIAAWGQKDRVTRENLVQGAGEVVSLLRNGMKDPQFLPLAYAKLQAQADAFRDVGNEAGAKEAEAYISAAKSNPEAMINILGSKMVLIKEGREAWDQANKNSAAPHDENLTDAQAAKAWAEAEQIRLKNETPQGTEIDTDARRIMNTATDSAGNSLLLANQSDNLATAFDKLKPAAGWTGNALELLKKATGGQDKFTSLKQEYVKLRNTDVLKNLPPGVASDRDIEIALKAFPDENANPDQISAFLKGTAKLNRYAADVNRAKAEWVNQNGSLGPARSDFTANKLPVKKGTNFLDFTASIPIPNVTSPGNKPKVVEGDF